LPQWHPPAIARVCSAAMVPFRAKFRRPVYTIGSPSPSSPQRDARWRRAWPHRGRASNRYGGAQRSTDYDFRPEDPAPVRVLSESHDMLEIHVPVAGYRLVVASVRLTMYTNWFFSQVARFQSTLLASLHCLDPINIQKAQDQRFCRQENRLLSDAKIYHRIVW
jgi:hypothetical protein